MRLGRQSEFGLFAALVAAISVMQARGQSQRPTARRLLFLSRAAVVRESPEQTPLLDPRTPVVPTVVAGSARPGSDQLSESRQTRLAADLLPHAHMESHATVHGPNTWGVPVRQPARARLTESTSAQLAPGTGQPRAR